MFTYREAENRFVVDTGIWDPLTLRPERIDEILVETDR